MKSVLILVALTLGLAACSDGATSGSTVAPSTTSSPTTTTGSAGTAPPSTVAPADVPGLLLRFGHQLVVRPDGGDDITIPADFEIPLRAAFGDGNGGIVYQYSRLVPPFPNDSVLHLRSGTSDPIVLIETPENRRVRLLDVGIYQGLPQLLFLETGDGLGRLKAVPLAGGSSTELAAGADIIDGSFSGELLGIVERAAGCTSARLVDVAGEPIGNWACDAGVSDLEIADDQSGVVALAQDGGITFFDLDDHSNNISVTVGDAPLTALNDFNGTSAAVSTPDGFKLVNAGGSVVDIEAGAGLQSVTQLTVTGNIPETAFLGGVREPGERCSAEGLALRAQAQDGLPGPVAFIRTEIVEAATVCDYDRMVELTAPGFIHSFGGGTSPLRTWVQAEQSRQDVLAQIVSVLDTPYTTSSADDGTTLYVWPGAFQDNPSEADWEALVPIFNEEEVDLFRANGYTGMRVIIQDDGDWITAVAGD